MVLTAPHNGHRESDSGVLGPIVTPIAHRLESVHLHPMLQRDPEFLRRQLHAVTRFVNLFSPEVRGAENLPAEGAVLLVGNHSCLFYMPDAWVVGLEILRRRGLDHPAYALAYDLLFGIPGLAPLLRRVGILPAGSDEAELALSQGSLVLVYPGGDLEACRPWTQRDRIELGGHQGFVRLALHTGVPVVPVVAYGSHHAVMVVSRGDRLAGLLGLHRIRINVFPIVFGPPFGLTTILTPPLPLPAAVTVEFLPALDWSGFGPAAADDPEIVSQCYDEISGSMQGALDRLRAEHPHPVARGLANLMRRGPLHLEVPSP